MFGLLKCFFFFFGVLAIPMWILRWLKRKNDLSMLALCYYVLKKYDKKRNFLLNKWLLFNWFAFICYHERLDKGLYQLVELTNTHQLFLVFITATKESSSIVCFHERVEEQKTSNYKWELLTLPIYLSLSFFTGPHGFKM